LCEATELASNATSVNKGKSRRHEPNYGSVCQQCGRTAEHVLTVTLDACLRFNKVAVDASMAV